MNYSLNTNHPYQSQTSLTPLLEHRDQTAVTESSSGSALLAGVIKGAVNSKTHKHYEYILFDKLEPILQSIKNSEKNNDTGEFSTPSHVRELIHLIDVSGHYTDPKSGIGILALGITRCVAKHPEFLQNLSPNRRELNELLSALEKVLKKLPSQTFYSYTEPSDRVKIVKNLRSAIEAVKTIKRQHPPLRWGEGTARKLLGNLRDMASSSKGTARNADLEEGKLLEYNEEFEDNQSEKRYLEEYTDYPEVYDESNPSGYHDAIAAAELKKFRQEQRARLEHDLPRQMANFHLLEDEDEKGKGKGKEAILEQ